MSSFASYLLYGFIFDKTTRKLYVRKLYLDGIDRIDLLHVNRTIKFHEVVFTFFGLKNASYDVCIFM